MPLSIKQKIKNFLRPTRYNRSFFASPQSLTFNRWSGLIQNLTSEEMLSFGIISRAIQIISADVAKVKFRHYKQNTTTEEWQELNSGLSYLLNIKPNSKITAFEFKKILIWNLFLYGNAYIWAVREDGEIKRLIPIPPLSVTLKINESNNQEYYEVNNASDNKLYIFSTEDIVEIKYESIQGLEDVNFTSLFKTTLSKIKANELNLINALKHDTSFSAVIKIDNITHKAARLEATKALEDMIKDHTQNGIATLVIDKKWELAEGVNIKGSKVDTQLRNMTAIEVASVFGIPPQKLGIETSNKYNSFGELTKSYIDNALTPLLRNITEKLTNEICDPNTKIDYSPFDMLSLDPKAIQEYAASGINNGWLMPNEIRKIVGVPMVKSGGNSLLINSTLVPLNEQIIKLQMETQVLEAQRDKTKAETQKILIEIKQLKQQIETVKGGDDDK